MRHFKKHHLSEKSRKVSMSIPGPNSIRLLELQNEIEGSVVSYPRNMPIAIKRAKGAVIEDVDGNYFLDFFAGCGVLNVGHNNEEVLEFVRKQQNELIHALDFPTENKMTLIQNILNHLPENLRNKFKVSFGGPTGSDAVEAAIKLAKIKTKRDGIIAFSGGYHGMSSGALAVTSDTGFRNRLTSLIPNVHFVPFSYCYRCPFNEKSESCTMNCVDYFKNILENSHSGISKPAAIIIEPIQGEGGNIVPKKGYLKELVRIAQENDVLVIFDEIQSGFFRTGEFLACMSSQIFPDIITFSKGFGGVGFPISGLIYKKEVEAWGPAAHIGTFRGNQVSIAAANGAFEFVRKYKVNEHAKEIGAYLKQELQRLFLNSPFIGEVRGEGLMIGIEFVKDTESREPFPELVKEFRALCFQNGLLFEVGGHYNNVVRLVPPLTITENIVNEAINIMKMSIESCVTSELFELNSIA